jgi:hypothetical protein
MLKSIELDLTVTTTATLLLSKKMARSKQSLYSELTTMPAGNEEALTQRLLARKTWSTS